MARNAVLLCLMACLASVASAKVVMGGVNMTTHDGIHHYNVHWTQNYTFTTIDAECGDIVEFKWKGNLTDVGVAMDGECASIRPLITPTTEGNYKIRLDANIPEIYETGEVYLANSVNSKCEDGQIIAFRVDCETALALAPAYATAWAPAPGPSSDRDIVINGASRSVTMGLAAVMGASAFMLLL